MTVGVRLDEAAWGLLHQAIELYQDNPRAVAELRQQVARLEQPLRIAIVGPWRSGKSTVLNALMGEEVAPVERADGAFTWYEDGAAPRATAYPVGQPPQELAVVKSATGLRVDLGWGAGEVRDIVVRWPTRALRQITLIDTPAVTGGAEQGRAPVLERVLRDSDAVLYLTRDGRDSDLRVLESARDSAVGQSAPVNVIMVLSRADETGGGRIDGLLTARQLARRHYRDPRVNALSVNVVACSGMIGLAGRMLGESDFAALATLAQVPRAELDAHLISADRFLRGELPVRLDTEVRAALLGRFGVFGVRLAATLVRSGFDSRVKLSAELIRRSGLTELRESVTRCFIDRRDALRRGPRWPRWRRCCGPSPPGGPPSWSARWSRSSPVRTSSGSCACWWRCGTPGWGSTRSWPPRRNGWSAATGWASRLGSVSSMRPTCGSSGRSPPRRSGGGGTGRRILCCPLAQRRGAQVVVRSWARG